jgi:hypothetical protein
MIRHGGGRPVRAGSPPTARAGGPSAPRSRPEPVANLVWIDAREAIVLHWEAGTASVRRLTSDVPAHHHSTGHVRHDPAPGNAGAGPPRTAGESHRLEHLARFVDEAAGAVPGAGDVLLLGPGTVHERLTERLASLDARSGRTRTIVSRAAGHRTERQLIARLRELAGSTPPRRTRPGSGRTAAPVRRASGAPARAAGRSFEADVRRHAEPELEVDEDDGLEEPDEGGDEEFDAAIGFVGVAAGAGAGPGEPGSS